MQFVILFMEEIRQRKIKDKEDEIKKLQEELKSMKQDGEER